MNNTLLKELRKQAEIFTLTIPASLTPTEFQDIFEGKFAELIVQECTRYIKDDYTRDFDMLWREDLTANISKHFGVES